MRKTTFLLVAVMVIVPSFAQVQEGKKRPPNVVVIVSDDAGYADFGFQGSKEMKTPRIDSIARHGVQCLQGYVSASVCSPSRAGLITGRHQQRFGHEYNIPPRFSEENGLPLDERTMADALKARGYRTIALGKWHLGYADHFHPLSRGFDDFFGFLQGARTYWPQQGTRLNRLLRDREPVPEKFDYMTDELGRQAAAYVAKHAKSPFFMYVSFNAVHTPMHALDSDLSAHESITRKRRRKLAAMTASMDRAVGMVLDALKKHGVNDDTLLFFINDNGGATNNACSNGELRGRKGTPYEGGIRVPFLIQWPGVIPPAASFKNPVSTLDIMATALAHAPPPKGPEKNVKPLDGVDLIPHFTGKKGGRPHETLFWRQGSAWAVRHGDLKLVHYDGRQKQVASEKTRLFDISVDPGERNDLAAERPEAVKALETRWKEWNAGLAKPRWRGLSRSRQPKK